MLFRTAHHADLDRTLIGADPTDWLDHERFSADLERGQYSKENIWLAIDDDNQILAHAIWWTLNREPHPYALDSLVVVDTVDDREQLAADLLAHAHRRFIADGASELPGLYLSLPPEWRNDPDLVDAVGWRREALRRVGLSDVLERMAFVWEPPSAIPTADERLRFVAEPDDTVFRDVCLRLAHDSLDVGTIKDVARMGLEEAVQQDFDRNRAMPGDRNLWRLAYTHDGQLVGMVMPSANDNNQVIAYIGVVPQQRGHGYVNGLLAEGTALLARAGATRVVAHTDYGNTPMAAAFHAAGYRHGRTNLIIDAPVG